MTEEIFREEPYRREAQAKVAGVSTEGIRLDRTVFYPRGGGQAGDAGVLVMADGTRIAIADTVKSSPSPLGEGGVRVRDLPSPQPSPKGEGAPNPASPGRAARR